MNTLYLIRGLPGSGKSTLAHKLADVVCEADEFFIEDNVYTFNKEFIGKAHEYCQLKTLQAMISEAKTIAVANTFTRRWEMQYYINLAKDYGYTLIEISMTGELFSNIHNVPLETIELMRNRWER